MKQVVSSARLGDCDGGIPTLVRRTSTGGRPGRAAIVLIAGLLLAGLHTNQAAAQADLAVTLRALEDFPVLEVHGYVPMYRDQAQNALAINSVIYPDTFAAAETTWQGESGIYNVVIHTVPEYDGEPVYRLHVNGRLAGEFVAPKSDLDFGLAIHAWPAVELHPGDVIRVASNSTSNGMFPEGDGFGYARGRWSQLVLIRLRGI